MADNVTVDNGFGTDYTVVTDEITSPYTGDTAQAQAVKLLSGTADSNAVIPGDASNGLDVDVTRVQGTVTVTVGAALPAGNNNIGDVDIASALPAGTNAIGKLAANSGVDIGDVDVTSVTPGTGAAALGKAEDAVHGSGDTGVMALAVRKDTASALAGSDGDYIPLIVDAAGRLHVNVGSLPAAARTTDTISAALAADVLMDNLTALTPARAIIDAAASGDNTLVAAQGAGNAIRVHQLFLIAAGTVNVRFESGAGGTALTGQMNLVANTGFVLPFSPVPWFVTSDNALLNLELSAAVSVDGALVYTVA